MIGRRICLSLPSSPTIEIQADPWPSFVSCYSICKLSTFSPGRRFLCGWKVMVGSVENKLLTWATSAYASDSCFPTFLTIYDHWDVTCLSKWPISILRAAFNWLAAIIAWWSAWWSADWKGVTSWQDVCSIWHQRRRNTLLIGLSWLFYALLWPLVSSPHLFYVAIPPTPMSSIGKIPEQSIPPVQFVSI